MSELSASENSGQVRKKVEKARRFSNKKEVYANAQMSSKMIREFVELDREGNGLIKIAMDRLGLSARAYDRILKVSRTITDLEGSENVQGQHLSEAIHYRSLDRESWGG